MPPLSSANKSKNKNRDARGSRSRNTTPNSVLSAGLPSTVSSTTPFLELETSKLLVGDHPQYSEILDRLETKPTNLEPKLLQDIIDQLKQLSDSAEKRVESCEKAIRVIHDQLKELESEHIERERQDQARKAKVRKEESTSQKNTKAKKRKERPGSSEQVEIKREDDGKSKLMQSRSTPGPVDSPSPSKKVKHSPGTSSLSDVVESPERNPGLTAATSPAQSDASAEEEDNRIIHKAPPAPQNGFFPDPLAPDPIIYHIRDITPDMSEKEKKEIFSVTSYPTKDLSDQIAGVPPDKDFSNAKPTNQVAANTFLTYVEPYVRPLTEEDMAFLRERGDRTTPFLAVPRGKRHYSEVWAEEDGGMNIDTSADKLPANQPRGSLETLSDDNLTNDQVSAGPLASRLLSLLKFEHRPSPNENSMSDLNAFADVNDAMDLDGLTSGHDSSEKSMAPAASVADLVSSRSISQKLDYVQSEERIKSELRYLGLLGQEGNPDFDAHHDDDISERLRLLQGELRRVMIVNGARKARLLDLAKERLAYQEYSTIHEDLDSQVQQAYLKRTRTLGKTKKGGSGANKPRPGHVAATAGGFGVNRARDIGDNARMLMDRRRRWQSCIGPVFKGMKHGVPGKDTTLWESKIMEAYEKAEVEALEEEVE